MASRPKFRIKHLDPFPQEYEKFYNDHFTIRSLMVKYFSLLKIIAFKESPIPDKVIIGKNGWLFMGGDEMDTYIGKQFLNNTELEEFKLELEYRKKYLNERGCKFYFIIAPAKPCIYSEKTPYNLIRYSNLSWGEQLIEYLNKNCDVKPINVYNILREKKEENQLYLKLDNHWNDLGAFYATNEILKQINIDFPEISKDSLDKFTIIKTETSFGNLAKMLSNIDIYKDYSYQLIPKKGFQAIDVPIVGYPCVSGFPVWDYEKDKEIKNSKKPKILIISDSFGNYVYPLLAEHFSRTVRIFDGWQYKLNEEIVNKEKPDVFLLLMLESNFRKFLVHQSRLSQNQKEKL